MDLFRDKRLNERVLDIEPLARIFIQKHSNGERIDLSRSALEKLSIIPGQETYVSLKT